VYGPLDNLARNRIAPRCALKFASAYRPPIT
jgi:hypothetical protein